MGIWDSFHLFSARAKRQGRRVSQSKHSGRGKRPKTRDLRMERFEDRVLLSIVPGIDEQLVWEETLSRAIDRAINLESYSQDALADTDRWVVSLGDGYSPEETAAPLGADSIGAAEYLPDTYVWEFSTEVSWQEAAGRLASAEGVTFFYPLVPLERVPRQIAIPPDDPFFPDQWHLENTGQTGGTPGEDANVLPVWDAAGLGITGNGVVIGIVDTGIEYTHPDLAAHYLAAFSYDFNYDDFSPLPDFPWQTHGTSVAGVAAAEGNNAEGVTGAAPDAGLAGLRLLDGLTDDSLEASALTYSSQDIDIYNNSWGPPDATPFGVWLAGPQLQTQMALRDGVMNGRGGLGSIFTWAAGNGGEFGDNVNYDGYANSRYTIAVGAIDHDGRQSPYSEPGAPLFISAYSDNWSDLFGVIPGDPNYVGVTTTDRTGEDGYNATGTGEWYPDPLTDINYTSIFGGTSSATPLVSGVIALMLEANPNLTYRDVQHILVETAEKNDPTHAGWTVNAAGHDINHSYGFGSIDAEAAVNLAMTWQTVGEERALISGVDNVGLTIPDNDPTGVTRVLNMPVAFESVEWVEVVFDASHQDLGDLEVVLTSPSGTQSVLSPAGNSLLDTDFNDWMFTTARNWGESPDGQWKLTVRDLSPGGTGTWDDWQLIVYGSGVDIPPELVSIFAGEDDLLYNAERDQPEDVNGESLIVIKEEESFPEHVAPRELMFRFAEGQQMINDEAVLRDTIQIVRSGGDDVFGNDNDAAVEYGWIGIGERPNEVIARFAETLPDDLYRIYLIGDPNDAGLPDVIGDVDEPLSNVDGLPFHDGKNLEPIEFDLDLGAQVVAVVPQPISRDRMVTAPAGPEITDGETFTVQGGVDEVTFEFNMAYVLTMPTGAGLVIPDGETFTINDGANDPITFEFNRGYSLVVPASPFLNIADGETFTISDGVASVTYEFEDLSLADDVASGHVPVGFNPPNYPNLGDLGDSDVDIAQAIYAAIVNGGPSGVMPFLSGAEVVLTGAADLSVSAGLAGLVRGDAGIGAGSDVQIDISPNDTAAQVAQAVHDAILNASPLNVTPLLSGVTVSLEGATAVGVSPGLAGLGALAGDPPGAVAAGRVELYRRAGRRRRGNRDLERAGPGTDGGRGG
jgi:subtilisin family serine protease